MTRVPSIPPKPSDKAVLDDIQELLDPKTPEGKEARARFIRDELARIGNEIDGRKR